jgi:hypothetical protein
MKLALTILFFLNLAVFCNAQSAGGEQSKYIHGDTTKQIILIDSTVQKIIKDSATYRRILVEKDAQIERCYYLQEKELRVVQARYLTDTTLMIVEWFFNKERMILSQQRWIDVTTNQLQQTFKMYLRDENLIAWMSSQNGTYDPASTEFKELAEGLKEYARQLRDESPR